MTFEHLKLLDGGPQLLLSSFVDATTAQMATTYGQQLFLKSLVIALKLVIRVCGRPAPEKERSDPRCECKN